MDKEIIAYIDGAARGNPGPASIGVILYEPDYTVLRELSETLGEATNNQAEYTALIRALEEAISLGAARIRVYSDSELIVKQVRGQYKVKDEKLKILHEKVHKLLNNIRLSISCIGREDNKRADKLANEALDRQDNQESQIISTTLPPAAPGGESILHSLTEKPKEERQEELQVSSGGVVYKKEGSQYKVCLIAKKGGRIWALPKGRVEPGETPEETAYREVREETGFVAEVREKIDEINYYFYWKDNQTLYHKIVFFYLMPLKEEVFHGRDSEADIVRWHTLGEAYRMLTYLNEKEVMRKAQKALQT
ncbi:MAG: reverse transcriptase-like protein [bacterium]